MDQHTHTGRKLTHTHTHTPPLRCRFRACVSCSSAAAGSEARLRGGMEGWLGRERELCVFACSQQLMGLCCVCVKLNELSCSVQCPKPQPKSCVCLHSSSPHRPEQSIEQDGSTGTVQVWEQSMRAFVQHTVCVCAYTDTPHPRCTRTLAHIHTCTHTHTCTHIDIHTHAHLTFCPAVCVRAHTPTLSLHSAHPHCTRMHAGTHCAQSPCTLSGSLMFFSTVCVRARIHTHSISLHPTSTLHTHAGTHIHCAHSSCVLSGSCVLCLPAICLHTSPHCIPQPHCTHTLVGTHKHLCTQYMHAVRVTFEQKPACVYVHTLSSTAHTRTLAHTYTHTHGPCTHVSRLPQSACSVHTHRHPLSLAASTPHIHAAHTYTHTHNPCTHVSRSAQQSACT